MVIENLNRNTLTEEDWQRTISVSSKTISPRVRKLSAEQKELLVNSGRTSAREFVKARNALDN